MSAPAPSSTPALLLVLLLGVGAFVLFFTETGDKLLRPKPAAPPEPPKAKEPEKPKTPDTRGFGDKVLDGLGTGLESLLGGAGAAVGAAAGQAVGQLLTTAGDPDSNAARSMRKLEETYKTAYLKPLGIRGKGQSHQEYAEDRRNKIDANLRAMVTFAKTAHQYLARFDVERWTLESDDQGPVFSVFYKGIAKPFKFRPPDSAQDQRLAWAAEPIVRTLGVYTQAGGRIASPFPDFPEPGFADNNPYAPGLMRISERLITKQDEQLEVALDRGAQLNRHKTAVNALASQQAGGKS